MSLPCNANCSSKCIKLSLSRSSNQNFNSNCLPRVGLEEELGGQDIAARLHCQNKLGLTTAVVILISSENNRVRALQPSENGLAVGFIVGTAGGVDVDFTAAVDAALGVVAEPVVGTALTLGQRLASLSREMGVSENFALSDSSSRLIGLEKSLKRRLLRRGRCRPPRRESRC